MFHTLAATLLLPLLVNGRFPNGSLSASTYAVVSTSSTPDVGGYILAALGATSTSDIPSSISNVSAKSPNTSTGIPLDASASVSSSLVNHTSTIALPTPSTMCFEDYGRLCYNNIDYSPIPIAPTGNGIAYASLCVSASSSYMSASSSWYSANQSAYTTTATIGGESFSVLRYYSDASTLCDGHPRVNYFPATLLSTSQATFTGSPSTTVYSGINYQQFPFNYPSCSIGASDCDNLWQAYTSSSRWNAQRSGASALPPMTPLCMNSAAREAQSTADAFLSGCGPCTVFGDGVQLLYFPPTSVSRDMCASTPSASVTHYNEDAATIYDGIGTVQGNFTGETAVVDGKTFTSGTAYISIKTVYIGDRCQYTIGTPVNDALIAMPSESLLSLRYRQWHFNYWFDIKTITGYPFNYGDLQEPIPYSAWAGQVQCEGPDAYNCQIIYGDRFRPQLAIPPAIRSLRPEWDKCQLWYNGLYDPPRALQPATAVAAATLPNNVKSKTVTAEPSSLIASSIPKETALGDPTSFQASSAASAGGPAGDTQAAGKTFVAHSISYQASSAATAGGPAGNTQGISSPVSSSVPKTTALADYMSFQAFSSIAGDESASTTQAASKTVAADATQGSGKLTQTPDSPAVASAEKTGPGNFFTRTEVVPVGTNDVDGIAIGGQILSTGKETVIQGTTLSVGTAAGDVFIDGATSSYLNVQETSQTSAQQVSSDVEYWTVSEAKSTYTTRGTVIKGVFTVHAVIEGPSGESTIIETTTLFEDGPDATTSGAIATSPVNIYTVTKGTGITTSVGGAAETLLNGDVASLTSGDFVSASSSSTSTIDPSSATSGHSSDRSSSRGTTPSTSVTATAGTSSKTMTTTKSGSSPSKSAGLQKHFTYLAAAALCMYFVV